MADSFAALRFAKATSEDLETVQSLILMLNAIAEGQFPPRADGSYLNDDPEWLDLDDEQDCQKAMKRLFELLDENPSGMNRVLFTARFAIQNNALDPKKDHLAWHPDFAAVIDQRKPDRRKEVGRV